MEWYYASRGQRLGPVDDAELARMAGDGRLKPDDLVWNETMGAGWRKASEMPGLLAALGAQPPLAPAPGTRPARPPSCVDAVGPAWQRMATLLFRPFDLAKWFALGFTAWLATLGEGSGLPGGFPSGYSRPWSLPGAGAAAGDAGSEASLDGFLEEARGKFLEFWQEYSDWVIGIGVPVVVLVLVVGLVFAWLQSRAKFLFLDNVVNNRAEVSEPWSRWRREGNSLFWWRLGFGLLSLAVLMLVLLVPVFRILLPAIRARGSFAGLVSGIVWSALLFLAYAVAMSFIGRLLEDFVIPVMYKRRMKTLQAWGVVLPLVRGHFWRLALYMIFYWILGIGAAIALMLVAALTCCVGGCLMAIPYVGSVVTLPVATFFRAYSIEYLGQFGAEFRLESDGS